MSASQGDTIIDFTIDEFLSTAPSHLATYVYMGYNPKQFKESLQRLLITDRRMTAKAAKEVVMEIVSLYIARGNKIKKMDKMSPAGVAALTALKNNTGINLTDKPSGPNMITPSRVVGVFPIQTALAIQILRDSRIVGAVPKGFPKGLCFPAAASLFPEVGSRAWNAFGVWRDSFTTTINSSNVLVDRKKSAAAYSMITQNTDFLDLPERLDGLTKVVTAFLGDISSMSDSLEKNIAYGSALFIWDVPEIQKVICNAILRAKGYDRKLKNDADDVKTLNGLNLIVSDDNQNLVAGAVRALNLSKEVFDSFEVPRPIETQFAITAADAQGGSTSTLNVQPADLTKLLAQLLLAGGVPVSSAPTSSSVAAPSQAK